MQIHRYLVIAYSIKNVLPYHEKTYCRNILWQNIHKSSIPRKSIKSNSNNHLKDEQNISSN